jgi:hypothetical protein
VAKTLRGQSGTDRVAGQGPLARYVQLNTRGRGSRWLPTAAARVRDRSKSCVGSVVARATMGRFSANTSVSPAIHSFH